MIADMAKRGEVSEIEHFATLIMGELHVVNDKIDTLSADTKSEFIKIREEIFDVRREVLDVRGELREVRKDVDFLVEQTENQRGFAKEFDERISILEHKK